MLNVVRNYELFNKPCKQNTPPAGVVPSSDFLSEGKTGSVNNRITNYY